MSPPREGTCTVSQNVPSGLTVSIATDIWGMWEGGWASRCKRRPANRSTTYKLLLLQRGRHLDRAVSGFNFVLLYNHLHVILIIRDNVPKLAAMGAKRASASEPNAAGNVVCGRHAAYVLAAVPGHGGSPGDAVGNGAGCSRTGAATDAGWERSCSCTSTTWRGKTASSPRPSSPRWRTTHHRKERGQSTGDIAKIEDRNKNNNNAALLLKIAVSSNQTNHDANGWITIRVP